MRLLLFYRLASFNHLTSGRQSGFTLIELLLIVVLLGVLSIAAINAFDGNEEQARLNITRLEMSELQKTLLQFRRDNRELPCRVYRSGVFNPLELRNSVGDAGFINTFDLPAGGASALDWQDWCSDNVTSSGQKVASNAIYMLNTFPYVVSAPDLSALIWNRNTQLGWNGPYISQEGLTDGWGNPYLLLESELTFNQTYRCENDSGSYAIDGTTGDYICLSPNDPAFNDTTDILPADIARIVSSGPDGVIDSELSNYDLTIPEDPCLAQGDDLVLCLLR
ncbi:type II secretion system protein GspG [Methylophaga thiooxydans]|uniref:type II secretion system protein GspG n=1 Tax=Methylophaga thiooxydans TaxID=392484 RepID=UPI0023574B1C|nr:type II secretion system protein GspG [Methylophaga thiooxydans]